MLKFPDPEKNGFFLNEGKEIGVMIFTLDIFFTSEQKKTRNNFYFLPTFFPLARSIKMTQQTFDFVSVLSLSSMSFSPLFSSFSLPSCVEWCQTLDETFSSNETQI